MNNIKSVITLNVFAEPFLSHWNEK